MATKPEKITNYEVGVKGRFLDGHMTLSADAYYDKWTDQLNPNTYTFAANDPANPYNVVGSPTFVPNNISIDQYSYTSNAASSTAKGVEVDATIIPISHVTVNLAGAINDTKYDSFVCVGGCQPYGAFDAAGKHLPNAPEKSFVAGLQYEGPLPNPDGATWFARADFIYRDGVYIESSNTVKTPNVAYLNLRAGVNLGAMRFETFVNNVLNNRSPISGFQDVNFATNFGPTAVMVGLPQLITGGFRISFKY